MRCFIWGLDLSERLTDEKNMSEKSGTIIRRDDARVLHAFGEEVTILLDGEGTGGKLTMWTEITPPGGAAYMPRGVVHTFKNVGDQPSRMLISITPSGVEKFFARCAEEFAKAGGPEMSWIVQIGAAHGIHFVL